MDGEVFRRVQEIFEAALERPASERAAFLDGACGEDAELRRQVETLLRADDTAGEFLERPAASISGLASGIAAEAARPAPGPVGPYRLLRKIGAGGMSEVWLAVRADDEYQKRVAVKVIREGLDSEAMLRRFRTERQILASLDHPNIATLYDGGSTEDGLPYFVMEYIDGIPIDEYCDRNGLGVGERLELFRTVCAAVQYAHQGLVVHRDIKASNILVTAEGVPKLLDFGIAKLLRPDQFAHQVEYTATWVRPMTPRYASPEQVEGKLVGTPSDVYSLGVLLYRLLTGHMPHRLEGRPPTELGRLIVEEEPERPSTAVDRVEESVPGDPSRATSITPESVSQARGAQPHQLRRQLSGDLDNIVLMALRKEPQRRYASVEQFAEDLRRYRDGLPVLARKDTLGYRAAKFARRNRLLVGAAAALVLVLAAFAVVMAVQASRIAVQRDEARRERDRAEKVTAFLEEIFEVTDPYQAAGENIDAAEILERGATRVRTELDDEPEVQASLLQAIGNVYRNLGLFARAEPLMREALEIRRGLEGPSPAVLAESLTNLGILRGQLGDFDEAESLLREAIRTRREILGAGDPGMADGLNELGIVLRRTGRYDEAEQVYGEALAIHAAAGLREKVADGKNNLATVLVDQGRFEDAEALFREVVELRRATHGLRHPQVAQSLSNLGACIGMQGRYEEAEPFLRESAALYRAVLPDDHPSLVESCNNLGKLLQRMGRPAEAEPLLREALAIQQKRVGRIHPWVGLLLSNISEVLEQQGDLAGAEAAAREALEVRREALDAPHAEIGSSLIRLASVLTARERPQAAEALLREAVETLTATLPEGHWRIGDARSRLGASLGARGQFELGETLLLEGHETVLARRGPDHPVTRAARARIVALYEAWGRPDDAERHRAAGVD